MIMTLSSIQAFRAIQTILKYASHSDLKELGLLCLTPDHSKQIVPSFHTMPPHAVISSLIDQSVAMITVSLCFPSDSQFSLC